MYDRKTYLYFVLAIIGFLLWNAWQKDYAPKDIVSSATPVQTSPIPGAVSPKMTPQATVAAADRIVEVKTDTLNIKIDKLGGNIISLTMPQYPTSYKAPLDPQPLLVNDPAKYYAATSSLVGKNGPDTSNLLFNTDQNQVTLSPTDSGLTVKLQAKANDVLVTKSYTFKRGMYDIDVNYEVTNTGNAPWAGNMLAQIKRRGISTDTGPFGLHTYTGAAISSDQKPYEKLSYKEMDKANLDRIIKGGWLSMQERYFLTAWVPKPDYQSRYFTQVQSVGSADKAFDKVYTVGLQSSDFTIAPQQTAAFGLKFYGGPEITDNLKKVAPHLDLTIDYGWLSIFSLPIFKVMQWIYNIVGNWGVAIILVTVLIKLLFYKLSETSYRSMARMKTLQPKLLALKDRYGDDRQKLSQATMELYKKEKVNPLGGCLPMLVQIPVFIALYYVLIESVELRQAPFMLWIHDLSAKDPYYILPILMGLSWMLQQRLNPPPPDPVQAKMMMLFPVVFTVLFATFPSGLVLYWLVNNCLSILQQWYIMKKVEKEEKEKKKTTKVKKKEKPSKALDT